MAAPNNSQHAVNHNKKQWFPNGLFIETSHSAMSLLMQQWPTMMWHEGWLVQDKTDNIVTMMVNVMSKGDKKSHCPNRNVIRLHKICLAGTWTAACAASHSWLRLLINWFSLSSWSKHSSFPNTMLLSMQWSACVKKWTTRIWRMWAFMSTSVCPMGQMGLTGVQRGDSWAPDGVSFDPTSCRSDKSEQSPWSHILPNWFSTIEFFAISPRLSIADFPWQTEQNKTCLFLQNHSAELLAWTWATKQLNRHALKGLLNSAKLDFYFVHIWLLGSFSQTKVVMLLFLPLETIGCNSCLVSKMTQLVATPRSSCLQWTPTILTNKDLHCVASNLNQHLQVRLPKDC